MSRTHLLLAGALVLGAAACVDRPAPVATDGDAPGPAGPAAVPATAGPRPERLARLFAVALRSHRDPARGHDSPGPETVEAYRRWLARTIGGGGAR